MFVHNFLLAHVYIFFFTKNGGGTKMSMHIFHSLTSLPPTYLSVRDKPPRSISGARTHFSSQSCVVFRRGIHNLLSPFPSESVHLLNEVTVPVSSLDHFSSLYPIMCLELYLIPDAGINKPHEFNSHSNPVG